MCRNHRGFVEASIACSKLGAHALYLNTAFARPQVSEVVQREAPALLIHDAEFADAVSEAAADRPAYVAWHDDPVPGEATLEQLIAQANDRPLPPRPSPAGRSSSPPARRGHPRGPTGRARTRSSRPRRCSRGFRSRRVRRR